MKISLPANYLSVILGVLVCFPQGTLAEPADLSTTMRGATVHSREEGVGAPLKKREAQALLRAWGKLKVVKDPKAALGRLFQAQIPLILDSFDVLEVRQTFRSPDIDLTSFAARFIKYTEGKCEFYAIDAEVVTIGANEFRVKDLSSSIAIRMEAPCGTEGGMSFGNR